MNRLPEAGGNDVLIRYQQTQTDAAACITAIHKRRFSCRPIGQCQPHGQMAQQGKEDERTPTSADGEVQRAYQMDSLFDTDVGVDTKGG